jgi:hypothetical protein
MMKQLDSDLCNLLLDETTPIGTSTMLDEYNIKSTKYDQIRRDVCLVNKEVSKMSYLLTG